MPLIVADRVQETSTTTGTGSFTLDGASTGYRTFASVLATSDTTYYTIADQTGSNWEVGLGTFTSPLTLARTTILSSSNSGSAVNFTSGTKNVFITYPAGRSVLSNSSGVVPVAAGGTGASTLTANNVLLGNGTSAVQFVAPGTSGNVLTSDGATWNSTAPTANTELNAMLYGDGSDGALTMTASGTVTLTRDQYYSSVAWPSGSTATFNPGGYRIFVSGTLDLTNAPAGAFNKPSAAGGAGATAGTAGAAAAGVAGNTIGGNSGGPAGGAGGVAGGTAGGAITASASANGNVGAIAGAGGAGSAGAGGAAGGTTTVTGADIRVAKIDLLRGATLITGGLGGPSGGGGGGDATSGGGGGGGGSGGNIIAVFANTIQRGASTNAWFQANGGNGGNGGSATAGNRGGGGAGSGGGGGWIYLVYNTLLGTANANALQANGGNGGTGGNGFGTGVGGGGGGSGGGGRIAKINALTGAVVASIGSTGSAGSAASGVTGGAGATGVTLTVSL